LDEGKFDVDKDFYQGQLLPIEEIPRGSKVVLAPPRTPGAKMINIDS